MQQNPPPEMGSPAYEPISPKIPSAAAQVPSDNLASSSLFDWSDFLDFSLDENLNISYLQSEHPGIDQSQPSENPGRVRKRDPKLVCPNYLAGRIPCACPELDEKLEEEESALPGKKRTRMPRNSGGGPARCQVPGCEADISELKGYHKRHRVCLRCANASAVLLDGESKRYCQQCGKFHVLSNFDEGKRSCRRKLERHNTRRRQKPNYSKEGMEKESQKTVLADDVSGDNDAVKDGICVSSQIEEREMLLESDGHASALCSDPGSQNLQGDSVASVVASDETHMVGEKKSPKYKQSPSYCDNKSTFSSVCPTGRISFKLYDWNPAEFPRRLRHQIFHWLASMPVELEGYIRPGCTILTAFIAMPKPMWHKLLGRPSLCIKDLVAAPGSVLSGRGTMLVHLNDMTFRVTKDATAVVRVKLKDRAPKLHYIYPTCFEAGKPLEFVACGSNLLQPNFRFLVSFAGRYMAYKIRVSSPCCVKGDADSNDHQLLKLYVPHIDPDLFGPAFVEVENQSGLSNFIPILVGDKETCADMEILQREFNLPLSDQEPPLSTGSACKDFASRQAKFSEFVLDVAWLLKKQVSEQHLTSFHIQRFNHLLNFLMEKESSVILRRVFSSLKSALCNNFVTCIPETEMRLLCKNMDIVQSRLSQRPPGKDFSVMPALDGSFNCHNSQNDTGAIVPADDQDVQRMVMSKVAGFVPSPSVDESATIPLLKEEVIMNINDRERPAKSSSRLLSRTFLTSRILIMTIAAVGLCFGVCAVILHPHSLGQIARTIRMCLVDNS